MPPVLRASSRPASPTTATTGPAAVPHGDDGPAVLHLDGTPVTADGTARDGFFALALAATVGDETFAVAGPDALRSMARHPGFATTA